MSQAGADKVYGKETPSPYGQVSARELALFYVGKVADMECCEECWAVFVWDKIPHEYIRTAFESRGEFWGAPCSEEVVVGFECPNCGHYTEL
jgi:hypothetical protein